MPEGIKKATGRCNELDGDVFFNMLRMSQLAKTNKFMKKYQLSFRHFKYCLGNASYWKEKTFGMIKTISIMTLLKCLMELMNV
jgi:hypothetical protein